MYYLRSILKSWLLIVYFYGCIYIFGAYLVLWVYGV
nr:MAG TPA: ATPase [Caudoviricetes sp.]